MASRRRRPRPSKKRPSTKAPQPAAAKIAASGFHPEEKKRPSAAERRNYMRCHPSWRFSLLQLDGPFGWQPIGGSTRAVRDRLAALERSTWDEILVRAKKQNHSVPIANLCGEAQKELRRIELDDVDQIWSLRMAGRPRVWGFLRHEFFYLLWWDPEHAICPSLR